MKQYDPKKIVATFKGILLQGYAEGSFLTAERKEDAFDTSVGAGGDVTRVRNNDKTGMVTVTLQSESLTNDLLSAILLLDEEFGLGVGALMVKDLNGTTLISSESSWIKKFPASEYADDGGSRPWVIECASLNMFVGGSLTS